jgi:hypothetical protein
MLFFCGIQATDRASERVCMLSALVLLITSWKLDCVFCISFTLKQRDGATFDLHVWPPKFRLIIFQAILFGHPSLKPSDAQKMLFSCLSA